MDFDEAIKLIKEAINNRYFPSAAIAIGQKDKIFIKKVFGYSSIYPKKIYADMNTLYDMASLTKVMATTMVAYRFIEKGLLHLHDRLSNFLTVPNDKEDITILNLLTHTSGLTAHFLLKDKCKSKDEAIDAILNSPLCNDIGSEVVYSCMGYIILGKILETIGNMKLDELSSKYVFEPLGMSNTKFCPKSDNIAATEFDTDLEVYLKGIVHDENARYLEGVSANAGLFSDIHDSAVFAQMLSNRGKINGKQFISIPMFNAGIHNYTYNMSESRGLGFSIKDTRENPAGDLFPIGSFGHTGYTGTSIFVDYVTGLYVVLLTNRVHYGRENEGIIRFRKLLHNNIVTEFYNNKGAIK
ncbi:serine hydrolase [Vallitalea longa]|uniref:Serine hydrolase n=1 Tax=Vallitalea longa TaxID=2936439 RepID=A0A9W5YBU8_9FIRM|nr:serine hydrolase domain-containing protein [Vallitalea longa]GKX29735.1 serine hydrolase [Vallitalea longa]